ncbi:MAG TPA: microcin ABC transporter permease, partial [Rhodospirillales bacterium]|nr:microcin ABC transporter permease [Rhodospirillales bacterium]
MTAYIVRRLLLIIPTLFAIMLINFLIIQTAPGGPVEQIIGDLTGQGAAITERVARGGGGEVVGGGGMPGGGGEASKYRGAQGLDPEFIASLERQFGFDRPLHERFFLMLKNYIVFDFGESYFRNRRVV